MLPWRTIGLFCGYAASLFAVRLLSMTMVTYLLMFSEGRIQDIAEVIHANELVIAGVGATLFWAIVRTRSQKPLVSNVNSLAIGLLWGAETAVAVVAAFWISGYLQLSGVFTPPENAVWAYAGALTRATCLALLLMIDEWIFRGIIQRDLEKRLPAGLAIGGAALLSLIPKVIQLDLGVRQMGTLFLFYLWVGLGAHRGKTPERGAAFLFALFFVWHFLCGLPLLGLETVLSQVFQVAHVNHAWIVGSTGDPLASPAVAALGFGAIGLQIFRLKKKLWTRVPLS